MASADFSRLADDPLGIQLATSADRALHARGLRLHLADGLKGRAGWLFALSDKDISAAIASIHDEPAHDWTVEELGHRVGMSRSIFVLRFKKTVGVSPMQYLTHWRILLAADRIANTSDSISEIAQSLGYESASAFTKVFKKMMGCSPREYNREDS